MGLVFQGTGPQERRRSLDSRRNNTRRARCGGDREEIRSARDFSHSQSGTRKSAPPEQRRSSHRRFRNNAPEVRKAVPGGVHKVPELVNTASLKDSLQGTRQGRIVGITGTVGNKWSFANSAPIEVIPAAVCLKTCDGGVANLARPPLDQLRQQIANGRCRFRGAESFISIRSSRLIGSTRRTRRAERLLFSPNGAGLYRTLRSRLARSHFAASAAAE